MCDCVFYIVWDNLEARTEWPVLLFHPIQYTIYYLHWAHVILNTPEFVITVYYINTFITFSNMFYSFTYDNTRNTTKHLFNIHACVYLLSDNFKLYVRMVLYNIYMCWYTLYYSWQSNVKGSDLYWLKDYEICMYVLKMSCRLALVIIWGCTNKYIWRPKFLF